MSAPVFLDIREVPSKSSCGPNQNMHHRCKKGGVLTTQSPHNPTVPVSMLTKNESAPHEEVLYETNAESMEPNVSGPRRG